MNFNDSDKVVLYTTSSGGLRDTFQACQRIKQILQNLHVEFEERDVFAEKEFLNEIRERLNKQIVILPQLFSKGQHIGGAEEVHALNESGELKKLLIPPVEQQEN